jgi:replication factor C large subunit
MVAEKEGLDIGRDVVEEIAVRAAGDVRGALNDLQSFAYSDAVLDDIVAAGTRDRELSTTEALKGLYGSVKISEGLAYLRKTDEQPSNTLLWIDELLPKIARNDRSLASSYEHLSRADIYLSRVFRRQQYSLWKYASDEMATSVMSLKGWITT